MNHNNEKNCPICPRGYDLSNPHCERGEEYARTGILPQETEYAHESKHEHENGHTRKNGSEYGHDHEHNHEYHHEHNHDHGHNHHGVAPRFIFEKREQQLIMKYLHHAVGAVDRGGMTQ